MRILLMLCLNLFVAAVEEPGDRVAWTAFPAQKATTHHRFGPVLTDIEQHLHPRFGAQYSSSDLVTHAHETTHGIHSDLRMKYRKAGFYCLNGKAAVFAEPKVRLSQVAAFVPAEHRRMRFGTYLAGSQLRSWDDTPTYILDEWVAYTNGAEAAISQEQHGLPHRLGGDSVYGQIEFIPYALAFCLAVEKHDPRYLDGPDGVQLKEFVAHELRRAARLYRLGMEMPRLRWDQKPPRVAGELRAVAARWYGEAFVQKHLEF